MVRQAIDQSDAVARIYSVIIGMCFFIAAVFLFRSITTTSPTNDEAVYVVVGNYGIFHYDWWSLNPSTWVGGFVRIYPAITALAYQVAGIAGSRFLSIIFALMLIETAVLIAMALTDGTTTQKYLSGILTAFAVLASPSFWKVGRLATYDCMSYALLFISIFFLIKTRHAKTVDGKWYFAACISFVISFLTKYTTALFFPLLLFLIFNQIRKSGTQRYFFVRYFFLPLIGISLLYIVTNIDQLTLFLTTQVIGDRISVEVFISTLAQHLRYLLLWSIPATMVLLRAKQWRTLLFLTLSGLLIIAVHGITGRFDAFEKHLFLSVGFLSILCGIGLSRLHAMMQIIYISTMVFFIVSAYAISIPAWNNTYAAEQFLVAQVAPSDRVLTESGASIMLALYPKLDPIAVITFDWFTYHQLTGESAYQAAVVDGYFQFMELSKQKGTPEKARIRAIVQANIYPHYLNVYENEDQVIFERIYE